LMLGGGREVVNQLLGVARGGSRKEALCGGPEPHLGAEAAGFGSGRGRGTE
jgi:hypothetical protein